MDLTKAMRIFLAVADAGGLASAATRLETSNAAVSRQIAALEEHLGARLFQRTTRRLALTESGRELQERAARILADLDETVAAVGRHVLDPGGHVRVSAPVSLGMMRLAPILPDFCRRYPRVTLDVHLSNRIVDFINDGVDVALRMTDTPSLDLIARKIAPVRMVACAAPSYLAARAAPAVPEDLADHEVLGFSPPWTTDRLVFRRGTEEVHPPPPSPRVRSNSGELLADMARGGMGILMQPDFQAEADFASGALVPVLDGWTCGDLNLFVVYPSRSHLPTRVRVFVDHVVDRLGRTPPPARS